MTRTARSSLRPAFRHVAVQRGIQSTSKSPFLTFGTWPNVLKHLRNVPLKSRIGDSTSKVKSFSLLEVEEGGIFR